MKKDVSIIVVGLALLALVWIGWDQFNVWRANTYEHDKPVACTADAKICPDGSGVGREGPNCEFAACPGE